MEHDAVVFLSRQNGYMARVYESWNLIRGNNTHFVPLYNFFFIIAITPILLLASTHTFYVWNVSTQENNTVKIWIDTMRQMLAVCV